MRGRATAYLILVICFLGFGVGCQEAGAGDPVTVEPKPKPKPKEPEPDPAEFVVYPEERQERTVMFGESSPTLRYEAKLGEEMIDVDWSLDIGEAGTLSSTEAGEVTFVPSGLVGGEVTLIAQTKATLVTRTIFIRLRASQNGVNAASEAQMKQIAEDVESLKRGGGIGGVGGEGLGPEITRDEVLEALSAPEHDARTAGVQLVYPYDGVVWPRGLPAPLIMWETEDAELSFDAVRIDLATDSGSFQYDGVFSAPDILEDAERPFIRHPIPQDIWETATRSTSSKDVLRLQVTLASDDQAYGPMEQAWNIAPTRPSGMVYYQAYGTNMVTNLPGGEIGAAIMGIGLGDTAPTIIAGEDAETTQDEGCRGCHTLSTNGELLLAYASHGGTMPRARFLHDSSDQEEVLFPELSRESALTSDGTHVLTRMGEMMAIERDEDSVNLEEVSVQGLENYLRFSAMKFSPDDQRVALIGLENEEGGVIPRAITMAYDGATHTFSDPVSFRKDDGKPLGWPSFLPDSESLVYQLETYRDGRNSSNAALDLETRLGVRGQIRWTSARTDLLDIPLDRLNGMKDNTSYLPALLAGDMHDIYCSADAESVGDIDAEHALDHEYNYSPSVNPVASGGYVWVVFTSRRRYGNVSTLPPFCSDPRGVDLEEHVSPKKIWVAALDVNAEPGEDPSHPAFYLPGQELYASNGGAQWVRDACRDDNDTCETGDQCCGGFCRRDAEDVLRCLPPPTAGACAEPQEACDIAEDCCDTTNLCVNNVCTFMGD